MKTGKTAKPLSHGTAKKIYNGNKNPKPINNRPRPTRGGYTW